MAGDVSLLSLGDAIRWSPISNSVPSDVCNLMGIRSPPDATSQLDHSSQDPSPEQQQEIDQRQQLAMLRQDTTLHGAAIGQTGTSTRQELTAWIRVLAIPCRSCYATDSASMMKKALKLIAAAERDMEENAKGIQIRRGNPFM